MQSLQARVCCGCCRDATLLFFTRAVQEDLDPMFRKLVLDSMFLLTFGNIFSYPKRGETYLGLYFLDGVLGMACFVGLV